MKRKLLLVILGVGTLAGYTSAFAAHRHHRWQRQAWKNEVADVCVAAAQRQFERGQQRKAGHDR